MTRDELHKNTEKLLNKFEDAHEKLFNKFEVKIERLQAQQNNTFSQITKDAAKDRAISRRWVIGLFTTTILSVLGLIIHCSQP